MSLPMARENFIEDVKKANAQGVECWLSWQNRTDELRLPVTPFFDLSKGKNNQTSELYEFGEINIPGTRGLGTMEIESFFPHLGHNYNFCSNHTDEPYSYCRLIDKWFADVYPIRVIFTNTTMNIAMMIENFAYGEKDGTRDVYFKLLLKEYPFIDEPALATSGGTTFENAVANSYNPDKLAVKGKDWDYSRWTVSYGDTLTGISVSRYGDGSHVDKIIELNKSLITKPNSLKNIAGQVLKLE